MSLIYEALRKAQEDRLIEFEKDIPSLDELEKPDLSDGKSTPLSPQFLTKTLQDIKKMVASMYEVSLLSMEKSDNDGDKEYRRKAMTQGFNKILSVVNMVSGYIRVTSPIVKRNTIHRILEEILESNKKKLHTKNILLTKNFDKELPETIFDDKQVRFILSSILQYAILSAPPGGSIEIVTRFVSNQKGEDLIRVVPVRNKYSEILIFSSYDEHPFHESARTTEVPGVENDETSDFILQLVKEIIRRNQGMIEFQMNQTGLRTRISLKFPVERRQVAYYRSVNP
jgi:hypothetical protein